MNDTDVNDTDVSERPAAEPSPAGSRCDNYERYLEDSYGYAYSARDIVAVESIERHDDLVASPTVEGLDVSADELSDFERLGLARGLRRDGDIEAFCAEIDRLLASDNQHPAVAYPEIPLLAALVLREAERNEQARTFLDRGRNKWPEAAVPMLQQQALVALATDGPEVAQQVYQRLADDNPEDAELRFEIAEDLWSHGEPEMAGEWARRAEEAARRIGDEPLLVDIRVLKERLAD
ncbi:MAG: tetratricopeptide repeat protein [Bradymonadaceae bacterium]